MMGRSKKEVSFYDWKLINISFLKIKITGALLYFIII